MGTAPTRAATARMVRASNPPAATASAASRVSSGVSEPRARRGRRAVPGGCGWVVSSLMFLDDALCTAYVRPVTYNVHRTETPPMTFTRWLPTFLAFPLGGLLAIEAVGGLDGAASGAAGGLIA